MKIKNRLLTFLLLLIVMLPSNVHAHSKYVIPGGETVGISVFSDGILITGFYNVNGSNMAEKAGFLLGDQIIKIDDVSVSSIEEMIRIINEKESKELIFTVKRNTELKDIILNMEKDSDGSFKTGLYVKDQITGIGTLTYIDPKTNTFGALGHEIIEKNTTKKFNVRTGEIFEANVVGFEKSERGSAGQKRALIDQNSVKGIVKNNEISGIFGEYTEDYSNRKKLPIADSSNIKIGDALIRTVIEDEKIEEFDIFIISIDHSSDVKNILFEIRDERLLDASGGIVQGMSGSPIIQDEKIIGAVTHVIVDDSTKGYGIFIKTMLEEGER